MTAGRGSNPRLAAVTFDFANTLVPMSRAGFRAVVERTADAAAEVGVGSRDAFIAVWEAERDRQFREDVPAGREADLWRRVSRVLARLRGIEPPPEPGRWDDLVVDAASVEDERSMIADAYIAALIQVMPPPGPVEPMLARLAGRGLRLGVISNWPLSQAIERYVAAAGWAPWLCTVVVSQGVGVIKPHPRIFAIAAEALGAAGREILHVGDDWVADIVGARGAGWRACHLRDQPSDWPRLPVDGVVDVEADLQIGDLAELEPAIRSW